MEHQKSFQNLIGSFKKLPGVGSKSAERMAFAVLDMDSEEINELVSSLQEVKKDVQKCPACGILMNKKKCLACDDTTRNRELLCVVQTVKDVYVFERAKEYRGLYHVLNGVISPNSGINIKDLNIEPLVKRVSKGGFKEVILATNPTIEGEATAMLIKKFLEPYPVEVSRLAYGLPVGGHLDYVDDITLSRAIEGRKKI